MLDARAPQTPQAKSQDAADKATEDAEVKHLMNETRIWRLANTAQWIAWGIVQAKIPGMPFFDPDSSKTEQTEGSGDVAQDVFGESVLADQEAEAEAEQDEEFDYLGYAQHRAMFFWGDALQLGLVKAEDLPEDTRVKVKSVVY